MVRWYYSTNGKAEGPVTQDWLVEELKAGRFTLVDLVFREGESAWKTFGEVPEFREAYQAPPPFIPPPPVVAPVAEPVALSSNEISLDEISIDEFTPTPILSKSAPAVSPAPVTPLEPVQSVGTAAPVHTPTAAPAEAPVAKPFEPVVLPESRASKGFTKPEEGWPSDWRLSSSWIVLKKRVDGSGYDQDGPFSAEHIIEMIGQGKIEYSQYCWKPGYTRWFRIGNLPEFDRRKRDREGDPVNQIIPIPEIGEALPALTREELLANVERLRREKRAAHEHAPAGTNGKNLAETAYDRATQAPRSAQAQPQLQPQVRKAQTPPAAPPRQATNAVVTAAATTAAPASTSAANVRPIVHIEADAATAQPAAGDFDAAAIAPFPTGGARGASPATRKSVVSPKMLRVGFAAFAALAIVIVLMQMAGNRNRQPASQPAQPVAPANRKPMNARPKTGAAEQPQPAQAQAETPNQGRAATEPPKVATQIEIVAQNLETTQPALLFKTDAGAGDKINVKVKGHTGDILKYGSYTKSFEIAAGSPLDLSKEELPQGAYFVEAAVGSAQTSTQIFVGKRDDEFNRDLERHIKSISLRQQTEKSALFYGAQRLEKLSKDLLAESTQFKAKPAAWKKAFAAWRAQAHDAALPVITLSQSPAQDQAFPDAVVAFMAATDKLVAQSKEVDQAVLQKRDVASTDDLSTEFGHLREDSAKLTGRPAN